MDFSAATTVPQTDRALYFTIALSIFFIVLVNSAMVFFVFRYSRKRHPVASGATGKLWLEIAWTVVPTAIALGMFYSGYLSFRIVRTPPPGSLEITVVGRMWMWMFEYPNGKRSPILYLPAGRPVNALLKSVDVIHGFYVPAFRVKQDAMPGRTNHVAFTPLEPGTFDVFCTQYCGTGHSTMLTKVVVMRPQDFQAWYRARPVQKPVNLAQMMAGSPEQIARGKEVYLTQCVACHGPDGRGAELPGARNFQSLQGWKNGPKLTQMFRTITNGLGQRMPSFSQIPVEDRFAVIHYVGTFAKGRPPSTPAEIAQLDKDFALSKGASAPREISVLKAMTRLSDEAAARKSALEAAQDAAAASRRFVMAATAHPSGAALYARHCATCHGAQGEGRAVAAGSEDAQRVVLDVPALNGPAYDWQAKGAGEFRGAVRRSSVAAGGFKPTFALLPASDWDALYGFVQSLAPATTSPPVPRK